MSGSHLPQRGVFPLATRVASVTCTHFNRQADNGSERMRKPPVLIRLFFKADIHLLNLSIIKADLEACTLSPPPRCFPAESHC